MASFTITTGDEELADWPTVAVRLQDLAEGVNNDEDQRVVYLVADAVKQLLRDRVLSSGVDSPFYIDLEVTDETVVISIGLEIPEPPEE